MSEVKLKCIKSPRKSKNITEGEEYEGIYVDAENNQVDSHEEADYFLCMNNAEKEARYKIELFEPIVPPKPSLQYLRENITVNAGSVCLRYNNQDLVLIPHGLTLLRAGTVNCSCGINSINGLSSVSQAISNNINTIARILEDGTDQNQIRDVLFKVIIKGHIQASTLAILLFSQTQVDIERYESIMDDISAHTEFTINPNSNNPIKAWLVDVNKCRAENLPQL